jgi:hypothetical protein
MWTLRGGQADRIAANIAKLPELLKRDTPSLRQPPHRFPPAWSAGEQRSDLLTRDCLLSRNLTDAV